MITCRYSGSTGRDTPIPINPTLSGEEAACTLSSSTGQAQRQPSQTAVEAGITEQQAMGLHDMTCRSSAVVNQAEGLTGLKTWSKFTT